MLPPERQFSIPATQQPVPASNNTPPLRDASPATDRTSRALPEQYPAEVLKDSHGLPSTTTNLNVVAEHRDVTSEKKTAYADNDVSMMVLRELAHLNESIADLRKENIEIRAIVEKNEHKQMVSFGGRATSDSMRDILPNPITT